MRGGIYIFVLVMVATLVQGATLHGEIYDLDLEKVNDVLVEIDTQQLLAKTGQYSFELAPGEYVLKASKGELVTEEEITVAGEGSFVYDLFLFPSFAEEDGFLLDLGVLDEEKKKTGLAKYPLWKYLVALGILLILIGRVLLAKKKYKSKNKNIRVEEAEPGYLEEALKIIKAHDGRMSQKDLRKEMMYLSEAKVSLIVTELEHKKKVERIKKGRGKIIILKD